MADNELNITVNARNDAKNEATEAARPIKLKYMDNAWMLDFNRRAIQAVMRQPELREAVEVDDNKPMSTMLAIWLFTMPQLITIASQAANVVPIKLATAQAAFEAIKDKTGFAARLVSLYVSRLSELMGAGNEDVTDNNEGNASWE